MSSSLEKILDVPVLICAPEGERIGSESDALDLIGNASYQGAEWVVVPVERFDEAFFRLSTRIAGDIVQKFVQYRVGLVVLGDISRHTEASSALRDFVRRAEGTHRTPRAPHWTFKTPPRSPGPARELPSGGLQRNVRKPWGDMFAPGN